ncbi:hypothetical protein OIO90_001370 [Microbotryomycetes sp. JL221]|nr:hypothetical protein OIO90_001370 [Microbotryomycetes sp. JL221]
MSPRGYLWVLSEPGQSATLEEFQDWYDNEHVPLRMANIREFLTGARYQASDNLKPGWNAAYEIESVDLFSDEKYTKLRANRSTREADLVKRLETLDRRTCQTIDESSCAPQPDKASKFVLTIASNDELTTDDGGLNTFKHVKGWNRTHRHKVYDSLRTGYKQEPVQNEAPKFVSVHEFDDESYVDTPEYNNAIKDKKEVRRWSLYRATPNTASE